MMDLSMELAAARAILGELHLENDELRADLTALRERMRWVPVGEMLPGEYVHVLVACDGHVTVGYMHGSDWHRDTAEYTPPITVTHWQPLPAAPEVPQ